MVISRSPAPKTQCHCSGLYHRKLAPATIGPLSCQSYVASLRAVKASGYAAFEFTASLKKPGTLPYLGRHKRAAYGMPQVRICLRFFAIDLTFLDKIRPVLVLSSYEDLDF